MITVERITPAIGGVVSSVDFAAPLSAATHDAIYQALLAARMNKPEDQMRWRWQAGDMAMCDNRVTQHYAVADYLSAYRCMNRVTVVRDGRV